MASFQLSPNGVWVPDNQARDVPAMATPFRGCDCADPALSADIAWPRDASESLKSSGFGTTGSLFSVEASAWASVGSEEYSVSWVLVGVLGGS
jgi:hypothetical protein